MSTWRCTIGATEGGTLDFSIPESPESAFSAIFTYLKLVWKYYNLVIFQHVLCKTYDKSLQKQAEFQYIFKGKRKKNTRFWTGKCAFLLKDFHQYTLRKLRSNWSDNKYSVLVTTILPYILHWSIDIYMVFWMNVLDCTLEKLICIVWVAHLEFPKSDTVANARVDSS